MSYQSTLLNRLSQFNSTTFDVILVDNSGVMPNFRSNMYFSGLTPGSGVIVNAISGLIVTQTRLYLTGVLLDGWMNQLLGSLIADGINARCYGLQTGIISRLSGVPFIQNLKINWTIGTLD